MRNDPDDVGIFQSRAEFQEQRDFKNYFWRTIRGYLDVCALSPVVAMNWDPFAKPTKLGVDGIHYVVDVQLATEKALNGNAEMLDQWQCLVNGDNTKNSASIINRCGRLYKSRRLAPASYLRFIKQGRPARRRPAGAAA
jgi:hypothetical protein